MYSFIEMPLAPTLAQVNVAVKAQQDGKKAKAHQALLVAEKGLRIRSFGIATEKTKAVQAPAGGAWLAMEDRESD